MAEAVYQLSASASGLVNQNDALTVDGSKGLRDYAIYLYGSGTVSGGTVVVEEAHSSSYAGTWGVLQSVTASTLNGALQAVHVAGQVATLRIRVSSAITGGGSVGVEVFGL